MWIARLDVNVTVPMLMCSCWLLVGCCVGQGALLDGRCQTYTGHDARVPAASLPLIPRPDCLRQPPPFYIDALAAANVFRVPLRHAPPGTMPHLWHVPRLARIDTRLHAAGFSNATGPFPNPHTDLTLSLQYDSSMRESAADAPHPPIVVPVRTTTATRHHVVKPYALCDTDAAIRYFRDVEDVLVRYRPRFLAIHDQLRQPSAECLSRYNNMLHTLFERTWPAHAEWEVG